MAYLLIILALLAAGVAAYLWYLGGKHDAQPAEKPASVREPEPQERTRVELPGAAKRERRAWAQAHEFDFVRRDEYLVDEWSRGAAATGAVARDIASGLVYGHEVVLMDLGGVPVMAMRTGASSPVVVDIRRNLAGEAPSPASDDLILVTTLEGFSIFGTEYGPVERFVDVRVETALDAIPETVEAIWMESEWVLAQTVRHAKVHDFDELLAPLALLADAARTLPPPNDARLSFDADDFTPSRRMPAPALPDLTPRLVPEPDQLRPRIIRPDEPVELPTRTKGEARGNIPPHAIGGDDVDPIAQEFDTPTEHGGARVLRRREDTTLFDDGHPDEE